MVTKEAELAKANKRIKELERALANRTDEVELLKKAERFFRENPK
jgi:transposase